MVDGSKLASADDDDNDNLLSPFSSSPGVVSSGFLLSLGLRVAFLFKLAIN